MIYGNTFINEGFIKNKINKRKEEKAKKSFESKVNDLIKAEKELRKWWENPETISSNGSEVGIMFTIAKMYNIPESKIADKFIKSDNVKSSANTQRFFEYWIGSDEGDIEIEYKNPADKKIILDPKNVIKLIWFNDDYAKLYSVNNKTFYDRYYDSGKCIIQPTKDVVYKDVKMSEATFDFNDEIKKEVDIRLGYYKLSQCPKGVTKTKFPYN